MLWRFLQELLDGEVGPETLSKIPKNVIFLWVQSTPVQGTELFLLTKVNKLQMKKRNMIHHKCLYTLHLWNEFQPSSFTHPLTVHFHQEVIDVIVCELTSHDYLWAIKQMAEVIGGQGFHCIGRITQIHV